MNNLAALQRRFQRHVYRPGRAMERAVLETPRAGAARRMAVYADAYRLRLVGALGADYPALQGLLGSPAFERMIREFVAAHPSRHANLRWYGSELAGFLARSSRWGRRPLLADLARFEWALGLAFDAADAPLVGVEEVERLSAADWPGMRLRLHPSVQRLWLRSAAPLAWTRQILGRGACADGSTRASSAWLVWRNGHAPFFRALPPAEAWALGAAARRKDFGALCQGIRRYVGGKQAAHRAAQFLKGWLVEGLVCEIN